jgi:hypothetical protein
MKIIINEILILLFSIIILIGESNQIRLQMENKNEITSKSNLENNKIKLKNQNKNQQFTNSNFEEDHIDKNKAFEIIQQFKPMQSQDELNIHKENEYKDNNSNYILPKMIQSHKTIPIENNNNIINNNNNIQTYNPNKYNNQNNIQTYNNNRHNDINIRSNSVIQENRSYLIQQHPNPVPFLSQKVIPIHQQEEMQGIINYIII